MGREWKPGDVAMVTYDGDRTAVAVYSTGCGAAVPVWEMGTGYLMAHRIESVRPLVVIDPEDPDHLDGLCKALVKAMWRAGDKASAANGVHPATVAAALREFANPTPPRPDEPTGLGAVVEDADGCLWIKIDGHRMCNDWTRIGAPSHDDPEQASGQSVRWFYKDIAAVRVLSEGV